MAVGFGWQVASQFPSADLVDSLHQRATNFAVFSNFVVREVLNVAGFLAGIALIGFAIFAALKNLRRLPSASNR